MIQPNFAPKRLFGQNLPREIQDLEKRVGDSFDRIAQQAWAKLNPTSLKTSNYAAKLDELVTTNGEIFVFLPIASAQNVGRAIGIVVLTDSVTVFSPNSFVQGDETDVIAATGLYLYISTGAGWWRIGGVSTINAGDDTIEVDQSTGDVVIRVGIITSANVDDSILTNDSDELRKLRRELQRTQLLLKELIDLEESD